MWIACSRALHVECILCEGIVYACPSCSSCCCAMAVIKHCLVLYRVCFKTFYKHTPVVTVDTIPCALHAVAAFVVDVVMQVRCKLVYQL